MKSEQLLQKILLIEDNPNDRLLIARELKREFPDIHIQEALDWTELNQAFADDDFDFVITDYELNWTTGLDVLRAVKAHNSNYPIIMFTNSGTQEVAVEAMKAGLDDYVIKSPKHFVRLAQAVRSVWDNNQIRRKASELEFRLQFLLNELKVGVFRSTLNGQLLEASNGLLQLFQLNSLSEAQTFFQKYLALSDIERNREEQWYREVRVDGSGKLLWLQINETLVELNGKTIIDGLVTDITEQKQTATALQSLNQTLEQRVKERTTRLEMLNRELEMFAFSVSHDLRTPIRQIDGFVSLLKQQLQSITSDETILHYLQQINELTNRAGKMIDDLLQFSRTGRADMHYSSVNMERLVQEAKRQVEPQLAGRNIRWQIESLPSVSGDRNQLRVVWQNLIENAVKYTRPREQAEITIGSRLGEGEAIFFVRDNGIGLDMDDAQRLFGVFQRLTNAQAFEGTGIGLANVQRVIHRHGGRLWVEGKIDAGATFYFSLPLIDSE
ncbi:MAG: ATP-binding protein [Scytonema sp. PMC 1069.18]|nr:ATP-binding protein [Scytonema sp. PMC 1069.18]MEC4879872.1 ATP-binding protein [Scytonema sp. PMC 1070.18]